MTFTRDAQGAHRADHRSGGEGPRLRVRRSGDLATFSDREGNVSTYGYEAHQLVSYRDPQGVQPLRNDYDDSGRLVSHTDAYGKTVVYAHELDARQEVVTDRLGKVTVYVYDTRGNVVRVT